MEEKFLDGVQDQFPPSTAINLGSYIILIIIIIIIIIITSYSMPQQPMENFDYPLMSVSLANSILVTLIFY